MDEWPDGVTNGRIEPRWFSVRHTESIRPSNRFKSIWINYSQL